MGVWEEREREREREERERGEREREREIKQVVPSIKFTQFRK